MKRLQMVIRLNQKDYSAVSSAPDIIDATIECLAQIQEFVYNTTGVMPTADTLYTCITRYVYI